MSDLSHLRPYDDIQSSDKLLSRGTHIKQTSSRSMYSSPRLKEEKQKSLDSQNLIVVSGETDFVPSVNLFNGPDEDHVTDETRQTEPSNIDRRPSQEESSGFFGNRKSNEYID